MFQQQTEVSSGKCETGSGNKTRVYYNWAVVKVIPVPTDVLTSLQSPRFRSTFLHYLRGTCFPGVCIISFEHLTDIADFLQRALYARKYGNCAFLSAIYKCYPVLNRR